MENTQQVEMNWAELGLDATGALDAKVKEVTLPNIPTLSAGKPGLEEGQTVRGTVVIPVEKIYSDKFEFGQEDADGRVYNDRIVLRSNTGKEFGIWLGGVLRNTAKLLQAGDYVVITYTGKSDKGFKKGQQPAHMFDVLASDAEGNDIPLASRREAARAAAASMN